MNVDNLRIIAEFIDEASAGIRRAQAQVEELTRASTEQAGANERTTRTTRAGTDATADSVNPLMAAGKAFAGWAAAIGLAALAWQGLTAALAEADKFDDLSEKTGMAASSLRDLSFAANQSGTSLDSIISAMSKLGKAADMSDEAASKQAQTFKQLGIDTMAANGQLKSTEQLMMEVADVFKNLEDGPEKSAAAFRLFGGEAKNLLPFLNQGSEAIADLKKESQELAGLSPAAFDAFAKGVGVMNDNIDKLGTVSNGFFQQLGNELIPVINIMAEAFINSAKEGGLLRQIMNGLVATFKFLIPYVKAGAEVFSGFVSTVQIAGKSIGLVMAAIATVASGGGVAGLKSVWASYKEDVKGVAQAHVTFTEKLNGTHHEAAKLTDNVKKIPLKSLKKDAKEVTSELAGMADALRTANAGIGMDESAKQAMEAQLKYAKDLKAGISPARAQALLAEVNALIAVGKATREAAEAEEKYKAAKTTLADYQSETELMQYEASLIGKSAEEREALLEKMREEIALRKQLEGLSAKAAATITAETKNANEARAAAKAALEDTRIANGYMDDSIQAAQDNFSKRAQILVGLYEKGSISITDLTRMQQEEYDKLLAKTQTTADKSTVFWTEAAKGMQDSMQTFFYDFMQGNMTSLVDDFQKMISKMVAQALAARLGEALFGTGFEKGNGLGGILGSFLGAFGGGRVNGGSVTAGRAYVVGEKRPELFVPDTSGTIIPSLEGLGSGGVTVQMSVNTIDAKSFMAHMAPMERDLATMVSNAQRKYNLGR